MKFQDLRTPKRAEMQLAPMIDIVFLLLIFFIVSWNFARFESDQEVKVPEAETAEQNPREPGEIIVNVLEGGVIRVSNQDLSEEELEVKLSLLAEAFPDQPVILRGDKSVPFKHVMVVLDACQRAGIWNVAFAAQKPLPAGMTQAQP